MELSFGLKRSAGISKEIPASLGETSEGDAAPLPVNNDQLRRRRTDSAQRISAIRQQLLRMPLFFQLWSPRVLCACHARPQSKLFVPGTQLRSFRSPRAVTEAKVEVFKGATDSDGSEVGVE